MIVTTRAPRLPLAGEEREQVLAVIRTPSRRDHLYSDGRRHSGR